MRRKFHPAARSGFTLLEVILALGILAMLSGAVYSIAVAAMEATKATLEQQASVRRLESFVRVTRDAFLNLPSEGRIQLRITRSQSGAPVPEMVFEEAAGVFGIPSLGGGSLILAARPRADGSRTMSILRVPKNVQGVELDRLSASGAWIPLIPRVERVKWTFFFNGEWREEWPEGTGRPLAVRLQMDYLDLPGKSVDAQFWIPPLQAPPPPSEKPTPTPTPP
jgi:prepilin-type N-terminal cleavage/methylation domain-containing protein